MMNIREIGIERISLQMVFKMFIVMFIVREVLCVSFQCFLQSLCGLCLRSLFDPIPFPLILFNVSRREF